MLDAHIEIGGDILRSRSGPGAYELGGGP